jgi:hypothetical protein
MWMPDPVGTAGEMLPPDATPAPLGTFGGTFGVGTAGIDEGGTVRIDETLLAFSDADHTSAEDLTFRVTTLPTAGTLFLDANSDGVLDDGDTIVTTETAFTQKDIDDGLLHYEHDDSENHDDSFAFTVDDGFNKSFADQTAGEPWTFDISVNPVNDPPTMDAKVFYAEENVAGIVLEGPPPASTAGPIAFDPEGDTLVFQFKDAAGNWVSAEDFANFSVNANNQLVVVAGDELDYELQSTHLLHVRVTDNDMAAVTSGTAEWQTSYFVVQVINQDEGVIGDPNDDFDTGIVIPDQTVNRNEVAIIPIDDDVFLEGPYTRVIYSYQASPADVPLTNTLSWLDFDGENVVFIYNPFMVSGPTEDAAYEITVTAQYWDNNGLDLKGEIGKSFTLNYIASLDADMLMEALDYIDEAGFEDLPVDGEGIEVQDFMTVARAGAESAPRIAAMDDDLSEVLALLDEERVMDEDLLARSAA